MSTTAFTAYNTPGYTAQNPGGSVPGPPPPPLPTGVISCTVKGTYLRPDDTAQSGNVWIRSYKSHQVSTATIAPFSKRVDLDSSGSFTMSLLTGTGGWVYHVVEAFPGGREYDIIVPPDNTAPYTVWTLAVDFVPDNTDPGLAAELTAVQAQLAALAAVDITTRNNQYTYVQATASDTWVIVFSLGWTPSQVRVVDTNGNTNYPAVTWVSPTQVRLSFSGPVAGTAVLS